MSSEPICANGRELNNEFTALIFVLTSMAMLLCHLKIRAIVSFLPTCNIVLSGLPFTIHHLFF